jgi:tripartite-type tricarboxylate transporter receptor subunit TctC
MRLYRTVIPFLVAVLSLIAPAAAQSAQAFPSQTVRIVVPMNAGTSADLLARVLADKLQPVWGQSVVVENRPGIVGISSVAKGTPDGHTLMLTANGYAAVSTLNKDLAFDPIGDVVGAAQIGSVPLVLIVPPDFAPVTLGDIIALTKSQPGVLNVASAGLGSTSHLASEVFKRAAEVDLRHVPYRGPDSITSVMRGDTQMSFVPVSSVLDLINSKKLRAVAVISTERIATLPNTPTFSEAGLKNFSYNAWFGLFAPAGTPRQSIQSIEQAVAKVLALPEVKSSLAQQGFDLDFAPSAKFDAVFKSDAQRFGKMLPQQ